MNNSAAPNLSNNNAKAATTTSTKDEVSLPGAEPTTSDDLTILQVINQITATPTDKILAAGPPEPQLQSSQSTTSDSSSSDSVKTVEETPSCRVLEIESHLIENLDNSSDELSSVGINELLPIQSELTAGTSKSGTETVIEVEPIGAKTKQPVQTSIPPAQQPDVASLTRQLSEVSEKQSRANQAVETVASVAKAGEGETERIVTGDSEETRSETKAPELAQQVSEEVPQESEQSHSQVPDESEKQTADAAPETKKKSLLSKGLSAVKSAIEDVVHPSAKEPSESASQKLAESTKESQEAADRLTDSVQPPSQLDESENPVTADPAKDTAPETKKKSLLSKGLSAVKSAIEEVVHPHSTEPTETGTQKADESTKETQEVAERATDSVEPPSQLDESETTDTASPTKKKSLLSKGFSAVKSAIDEVVHPHATESTETGTQKADESTKDIQVAADPATDSVQPPSPLDESEKQTPELATDTASLKKKKSLLSKGLNAVKSVIEPTKSANQPSELSENVADAPQSPIEIESEKQTAEITPETPNEPKKKSLLSKGLNAVKSAIGEVVHSVKSDDEPDKNLAKSEEETVKKQEKVEPAEDRIEVQGVSEEIQAAAESLVNEVQQAAIEQVEQRLKTASQETTDEQKTDEDLPKLPTSTSTTNELTSILKTTTTKSDVDITTTALNDTLEPSASASKNDIKIVQIPTPNSASDEVERQLFLDSLPQIEHSETDTSKLQADCKREYYQSLKKYLIESSLEKPPVPLQTYRWEDLKRAKERGGYPWTHLYKRPLGPDEEPEIILLLRKSQELRFASESPKSLKRVRYDEQVLVKETDRYIQELSDSEEDRRRGETDDDETEDEEHTTSAPTDEESQSVHSESISCVSDSCLAAKHPQKRNRLAKIKRILNRRRSGRKPGDTQSLPGTSVNTSLLDIKEESENLGVSSTPDPSAPQQKEQKLTRYQNIMKKLKSMADRQRKRLNIKRISLKKDEKIDLGEETKILKLKNSPKAERSEIPHFVEKQDSDDMLDIVELDESPGRGKRNEPHVGDEVDKENRDANASSIIMPDEIIELETKSVEETGATAIEERIADEVTEEPKRTPRLRREHVYEEIGPTENVPSLQLPSLIEPSSVEALKKSLVRQDNCALLDVESKGIPLDRMGSSEEEPVVVTAETPKSSGNLLAPISSIDSASSDEDRSRPHLSPVAEESDAASQDGGILQSNETEQLDLKPTIKKEPSPAPSDKKVTFSHVEDEAEPHREDVELPESVREAANANNKWKNMRDHDYEPIGEPAGNEAGLKREASPMPISQAERTQSTELNILSAEIKEAADLQKELEDRYFTQTAAAQQEADDAAAATERSLAEAEDMESPEDEAPKAEKRGFMATAQDHTRRMQTGIKNQATKIKTRLRPVPKKPVSGSPKSKKKERFKAPQFSKIKMPAIKKPDMSKIKDFKRPEFTKFSKPDMTKFKLPERLTTLKLKRSHSLKHEDINDNELSTQSPDSQPATDNQPQKKTFEFNFGTYPRAFRKKKKPVEPESPFGTEGTSIQPSNTTQPSFESSSSPQGDRGPGPVRSRWADKFSDVSYNDSEGSRYRRYGSEQESFDKESSLERRMKDDLEESASEINESMGILGGRVGETKQFAEFDEENRAIHEISNLRSGEFKRRPMVHQDSDLRSEDSKDAEGWTDKDIQRNKLLRKAEMEAEASFLKYHTEDGQALDNRSMASSTGRKVVMEEIDDDEFFLRKRGISEDNIELRQYISSAIREGYDTPLNALQNVGQTTEPPMEFGDYDVPPPKPRRLHKGYRPQDDSQEYDLQRSDYGDDFSVSQNGSDFFMVPKKPLRKDRSRSKYSMDSEIPMADERTSREQYFDNDEDYLRPPNYDANDLGMNDLSFSSKQQQEDQDVGDVGYPQPPRRQKRRMREGSQEKDSLINGLSGKSVSSSFLQQPKDVIVYRTEHEYHIPIATPETYTDDASTSTHKSRSASRYDEDDRTSSHGAQSFHMNDDAKENIDYNGNSRDDQSKFIIDMMENDGIDDDYEEPETLDRPESPRNLQSGEIINRMKYRPLPAPPRPPREKRQRSDLKSSLQTAGTTDEESAIEYADSEDTEQRGTASELEEVEAATQTDPLPDNYEVAELEITDSMRIIEPRRRAKTIEELLQEELAEKNVESSQAQDEDEQLTRGLQRFREANQRSLSERSRASSSQADRSKSLSRPQTPSAVVVESRVSTPSPYTREVAVLEASLLVKPLDDLDLEEAELRREGLLSDSSQQSKSDIEKEYKEYEEKYKQDERKLFVDDLSNAPSSTELNVTDYEQRLRSFDERDMSQSEQEQEQEEGEEKTAAEATLSDLEAEIEARYRKLYSRDLELDSKQFSQEEEDESKLLKSDYESEDDYRAQQQTETATEEYTVEQADETVEAKVKEIEKEAEVEVEQPFEKVVTKDTVDAAFTPSNLTTKQETEQEIREASPAVEEQPLPPPRRKSTTNIEQPAVPAPAPTPAEPTSTTMTVAEVAPVAAPTTTTVVQMPSSVSDLAVERLHVHALQAGQIMVSQMHGAHISSDQLECNTANLVVNNIQLPPGFIEDIVERVHRSTDSRPTTLLTVETQTSQTASSEDLPKEGSPIPPKKPARQKQLESQQADTAEIPPSLQHQQQQQSQHKNPDEQTQTDPIDPMLSNLPPLYPTAEYLQSLAPLAFYNMHRATAPSDSGERLAGVERSESMQRRRRPYRRHSSSSGGEEPEDLANANEKPHTHRRRTRSSTQPPEAQPPTIRQAATQFLSACSLSLVNIINQLTDYVRSDDKKVLGRTRQVPTLVALFVVITFVLLLFLLSGKNVHTHHWDFFNLPGNEGRK